MDARYAVVDYSSGYKNGEILGIDLTREEAYALVAKQLEDTGEERDIQVYDDQYDKDIYDQLYNNVCN